MGTRCNPYPLEIKLRERIRGFFNHLYMTFDMMLPFLKGFHNTIESWRANRDEDGWKREDKTLEQILDYHLFEEKVTDEEHDLLTRQDPNIQKPNPPKLVTPVPRLFDDVQMLLELMKENTPARVPARYNTIAEVICGFADASGRGLGSMTQAQNSNSLNVRIGVWLASE